MGHLIERRESDPLSARTSVLKVAGEGEAVSAALVRALLERVAHELPAAMSVGAHRLPATSTRRGHRRPVAGRGLALRFCYGRAARALALLDPRGVRVR